ncbi:peptide/nickel transport system substrate-binding protein [Actinopolymorpha singaporensis]|uniref:Peptide/nickel transport system substrate-binding protein n=2 Tax=Actinopolymorpha singaporensis TaxID=117157 RepID=A0A1H1URZ4_9ACTN|nr:peptide/nickel transport system substrate-binding protein [Actinopolymorpha singaporensis]
MASRITRRDLLRAGGVATLGACTLTGCSFLSTNPDKGPGPAVAAKGTKEAPMLAAQVKAGKLPKLTERLPKDPMVVKPQSQLGSFGGTMQRGQIDLNNDGLQYMGWAGLVEWTPTTPPNPGPGLAKSWEIEDGGRAYVFHLRDGVRWSDGKPFTTDDIMYVYEHVYSNKELAPVFPAWLSPGGKPARFVQVDKKTFRIEFAAPNGLLLKYMSFVGTFVGANPFLQPKHYMSRFHPDIAGKEAVQSALKKENFSAWVDFYHSRHDHWRNPDLPVLGPWRITRPAKGNNATAERNPYYWKVDPEGRQLPYIDRAVYTFLDQEAFGLRAANGQVDLAAWDLSYQSAPMLIKNQKDKGFRFLRWKPDGLFHAVNLNQSHPDPVLRELFQDINFRAGVSHAINREEMRDSLFSGQGSFQQPCAQPEDPYFVRGMGQRFVEFDEAKANEYLDKAGLTRRGSNGMRLRPDGKPMKLVAQTFTIGVGVPTVSILEFVKRYWAKVGIDMAIKNISSELWYASIWHGDFDLNCYVPAGYLWDIDSLWYIPTSGLTYWAPKYGNWYSDPKGKFSMKPEGEIRQLQVLYDELVQQADDDRRLAIGREILRLHDKNVWIINTVQSAFAPVVVSDDLGNVREDAVASYRTLYEAATDLSQLYFRHPERHT